MRAELDLTIEGCPTPGEASWRKSEPPKDGSYFLAAGAIISQSADSAIVEPFVFVVCWLGIECGIEGWHREDGLTVAWSPATR